jgi:ABC-type uncharacterized transport system ATPase subunit
MADRVKEIVDRIREWTPERQADLAKIAQLMEEQDKSDVGISDDQAEEIRRRLQKKNPESMTLDEFNAYIRARYGV